MTNPDYKAINEARKTANIDPDKLAARNAAKEIVLEPVKVKKPKKAKKVKKSAKK